MQVSTRHRLRPLRQPAGDVLFAPLLAATAVMWLVFAIGVVRGDDRNGDESAAQGSHAELAHQLSGDIEGTPSQADIARARKPLSERKRALAAHPYFGLYKAAKRTFGVSWYLVAAVHYQETGFGRAPATLARNSEWQRHRVAQRGLARPAGYPHATVTHPSVRDDFDVVTAIGAQLQADGAGAVIGRAATHALEERYGDSAAGRLKVAMVYERARAWHLLGTLPLPGRGELATPVKGVVGGCGYFGCPRPGHLHNGVDFLAPAGVPIRAVDGGHVALVESIGQSGGYGNFVCIQHRPHLSSCYAHMSAVAEPVAIGAVVRRGQVIGLVGSTGSSTAPHLHFEVRRGAADCSSCAIDPLPMLSGEVPATPVPEMAGFVPATGIAAAPIAWRAPARAPAAVPAPQPAARLQTPSNAGESDVEPDLRSKVLTPGERSSLNRRRTLDGPSAERVQPRRPPVPAKKAAPVDPSPAPPGSAGAGDASPVPSVPPAAPTPGSDQAAAGQPAPAEQTAPAAPPPS